MTMTKKDRIKITANAAEMTEILKRKKANLVVGEFLEHLIDQWGGPAQFAAAYHTAYMGCKEGSMTQARMLADILRLATVHTNNQRGNASPVEAMTDAELRDALNSLVGEES